MYVMYVCMYVAYICIFLVFISIHWCELSKQLVGVIGGQKGRGWGIGRVTRPPQRRYLEVAF